MILVKIFSLVCLINLANTKLLNNFNSNGIDHKLNILISNTVTAIIDEFYAKVSPTLCIIYAVHSYESIGDQSMIIGDILKKSDKDIAFRIDHFATVYLNANLRFYNIFFIDNYEAFR